MTMAPPCPAHFPSISPFVPIPSPCSGHVLRGMVSVWTVWTVFFFFFYFVIAHAHTVSSHAHNHSSRFALAVF